MPGQRGTAGEETASLCNGFTYRTSSSAIFQASAEFTGSSPFVLNESDKPDNLVVLVVSRRLRSELTKILVPTLLVCLSGAALRLEETHLGDQETGVQAYGKSSHVRNLERYFPCKARIYKAGRAVDLKP